MATDSFGPEFFGRFAGHRLQPFLDTPADRELVDALQRRVLQRGACHVRGKSGQGPADGGEFFGSGTVGLALVDQASGDHAAEHAVARRMRAGRIAVGTPPLWQLRQRHQQRRFRQRQPRRLLAEIGERCGAYALEIAAIGRQRQIGLEDLALAHAPFDLDGAQDLLDLEAERAALARLHQPRQLHRQRRAAGDDAAIAGELDGGAHQRDEVDALMVPVALVLVGDQHFHELLVDIVEIGGKPPAPFGRREGAQQIAVAVDDLRRNRKCGGDRRRKGAVGPFQPAPGERDENRAACGSNCYPTKRLVHVRAP